MRNFDYLYDEFQLEEFMINFLKRCLDTQEPKKDIVFLGDSLIRDYDLNKFFPSIKEKLFNCGISGVTTQGLFNVIKHGVIRHNPKLVVILVGTNDMNEYYNKRDEEIIYNISRIITELKLVLDKVKVLLVSILPCDEKRYGKQVTGGGRDNQRILELNGKLEKFEEIFKEITFVDVFNELSDEKHNLIQEYTHDGIHLTLKGYQILTDVLMPILEEFVYEKTNVKKK